jgi:transcriptional regulator with XRE-family HTH domain
MPIPDSILGETLKSKRRAARIPAAVLARKTKISTTRLSAIERGYIIVTREEMRSIITALDKLIVAKQEAEKLALQLGWPAEAKVCVWSMHTKEKPRAAANGSEAVLQDLAKRIAENQKRHPATRSRIVDPSCLIYLRGVSEQEVYRQARKQLASDHPAFLYVDSNTGARLLERYDNGRLAGILIKFNWPDDGYRLLLSDPRESTHYSSP